MRWKEVPADLRPAAPELVARALEVAQHRADASATDELMNSARNRTIARCRQFASTFKFS